jgi:hypothetical protein
MVSESDVLDLVESLTGQRALSGQPLPALAIEALNTGRGLGYSQFNELLLVLGYDRICAEFFQYLVDGTIGYASGAAIGSVEALRLAVERFRTLALLLFGNVKFAFKRFGAHPDELESWIVTLEPRLEATYTARHAPIQPVDPIPATETYLLGYMIEADLAKRLEINPDDVDAGQLAAQRLAIVERGRRNQSAYLVSDHLDVYVATSMRERHEFLLVRELCGAIFSHPTLKPLKLRWFDPTQAYCRDRIDKGLAEALMLTLDCRSCYGRR